MSTLQVAPLNTFYLLPFVFGSLLSLSLAMYAFGRPQAEGAREFMLFEASQALYLLLFMLEVISPDVAQRVWWDSVQWLVAYAISIAMLAYGLRYAHIDGRWLLVTASIFPALYLGLLFTNAQHGLVCSDVRIVESPPFGHLRCTPTGLYWLGNLYAFAPFLAGMWLWVRHWLRKQDAGLPRLRNTYFLAGVTLMLVVYVGLFIFGIDVLGQRDPALVAYIAGNVLIAYGFFRHRVYDVAAIARQRLLESLSDAVCIVDNDFRVVEVNRASLALVRPALTDYIGRGLDEVYPLYRDSLARIRHLQHHTSEDDYMLNGQMRTLDFRVQPIYGDKGQLVGRALITRDITERKALEQHSLALKIEQERTRLLASFVSDTSHEFRSPLSIIRSAAYLAEKLPTPAERQAKLDEIAHQVDELTRLIDDLTTMSRLDSLNEYTLRAMDINHLLRVVCQNEQGRLDQKGIAMTLDLDDKLPRIRASFEDMPLALGKLIDNAIQYTPQNGQITVRSWMVTNSVCITIQDNGVGIAPQDLPHIFNRMYRADAAHTTRGLGLGLSIARRVVELHGGVLEVSSELGKGSTFTIKLPYNLVVAVTP
jgi:PAS domain S-box-containing protein